MHDYILDALEMVSAWDLPDEDLADAVNAQAWLMAGLHPDDFWGGPRTSCSRHTAIRSLLTTPPPLPQITTIIVYPEFSGGRRSPSEKLIVISRESRRGPSTGDSP